MDGAVELKAPVNVGTVFNPWILGELLPGLLLALREPPPLPPELASLRNIPRELVAPLGSTKRIEALGGCTELMLTFGILVNPGFMDVIFGDGVWQKLIADVPSRNMQ
jgi:hypothetical protein